MNRRLREGSEFVVFSPDLYRHDLDQSAFNALSAFPKFVKLREAYIANVDEIAAKIDLMSTAIRISGSQFPEVYATLPPICEKLGIPVPELYYVKSKRLNAWTGGNTAPYICVTSRLVNELPPDLIVTALAHECGHIACKHYLYHSMASLLIEGVDRSLLSKIPAIRRYLTPTLIRALLFWDRCSELSADRAAVLCDGDANKTIDLLLRLHGYKNINREEFLKQAVDLKAFINDSKSNRLMELMLTQDETHPRLATRAYECYEWSKSERFQSGLAGSFVLSPRQEGQAVSEENEIISADLTLAAESPSAGTDELDALNQSLQRINAELERYTSNTDKLDYALAVSSGIFSGIIDSFFVGELTLEKANQWGNEATGRFVEKIARTQGYDGDTQAGAIRYLEEMFPIAADKATNQFGGGIQHHLRDFSHHPTPVGLLCSVLTQFTGYVFGTDVHGAFQKVQLNADGYDLIGKNFPEKIMFGVVNWMFHMASDIAGSSGSVMKGSLGTGLPGPMVSLLKELSATPLFQRTNDKDHRELSVWVSKLFNGTLLGERNENGQMIPLKFDLRTELGIAHQIGQQAMPVILNECIVRGFYFLRQFAIELGRAELQSPADLAKLNWGKTLPFRNRTVDRMVMISSMTFTIADTTDAAIHAAIESAGNWVLFSGRLVTRFNFVGAGRSVISVIKEIHNEQKESQLIHEKMILSEAKTAVFLDKLQEFKERLEEKVSNYLAEDIETFITGFDDIRSGIDSNNSALVIKGNLAIQKVLGREPQFTNQEEFDSLMESDIPFQL